MAITAADLDALDQAALALATAGIATVTAGGQTVTVKSLDELRKFRSEIAGQLAAQQPNRGLRFTQLIPPGGG